MEIKWKRVISVFFAVVAFAFAFFAFSFNMLKCSVIGFDVVKVSGFDIIIGKESFFDLECGKWVHISTNALFVVVISAIVLLWFSQKEESSDKMFELLLIVIFLLTCIYMINGFIVADQTQKQLEKELNDMQLDYYLEYEVIDVKELIKVQTFAWIPFLVVIVCEGIYFFLEYVVRDVPFVQKKDAMIYEKFSFGADETESKRDFTVVTKENNTEMLLKYKQLLDDGVITKEEFDRKKQQLLW